jgi:hypothetical protein
LLLRVAKLFFDLSAAQRVGRALQRTRDVSLLTLVVERHAIQLRFEIFDSIGHRAFLLRNRLLELLLRARIGTLSEFLHVGLHALFLVGQLLRGADGIGNVTRRAARLLLIEQSTGFLEIVEGLRRIARLLAVCRSTTHGVGSVLQATRGVGQRLILLFARETLELMRLRFRLLREVALSLATRRARCTHATQTVRLRARAIVFLLLPRRELTKLLESLVDLIVRLLLLILLLTALHGLVLIAQTILLELEDVGKILRFGFVSAAAAAATSSTSAH